jgi:hypothetical protein
MMGAKSIKRRRKAMRRMPLFMRFGSGWSLNLAGQQPGLTAAAKAAQTSLLAGPRIN